MVNKLKIYLASRWEDKDEVREYRDYLLKHILFNCTARWLDAKNDPGKGGKAKIAERIQARDIEDISAANIVVVFSPKKAHGNGSGGRHVELGIAIGMNKKIFLVGYRENVFHWNPKITSVTSIRKLIPYLKHFVKEEKEIKRELDDFVDGVFYDGHDDGGPPSK